LKIGPQKLVLGRAQ